MIAGVALAIGAALLSTTAEDPAGRSCNDEVSVSVAVVECETDAGFGATSGFTVAADRYQFEFEARCKRGESCTRGDRVCRTDTGRVGAWYVVIRVTVATGARETVGVSCLTPAEEQDLAVITPGMVRREFERLTWPQADLEVQPPDGQTLINFETNFFTRNTAATSQTVTLLGQQVTIEARPTSYRWRFGDGSEVSTSSPGAPYPGLDVTHDYADPGQVSPSVDTVYEGRYRINGGAWQTIPGSLTVGGDPVALRVRSASPHLVGASG